MKKTKLPANINVFKRAFYKGRAGKFRKLIGLMLIFGIVASFLYFCKFAYVESAVSRAHIILNYPEIAESKNPDGSRFTYYDFVSDENLEKTLKLMQADGKYKYFTVDDLRDQFYIYSQLDGSARASVSTARSEGNDFSYVANEYKITFVQPHDYKNPNIFRKFFSKDLSGEFLETLVEVNRRNFAETLGGIDGFKVLTAPITNGDYDYGEQVSMYKNKVNYIIAQLKQLEKQQPDFVSKKYGLTLNDVRGKYSFLITNSLDGINNFVESSGISKDIGQTSNKINVNIENNRLKLNKAGSRVFVNSYAMQNYDQTFTENLINVIQNQEYGLYQARPKTAFDTVSHQKHGANESVSEYEAKINVFNKELGIYQNVVTTPEENARLTVKCDGLIKSFEEEYESLTKIANEIVTEYYNDVNEGFVTAKITPKGLISKNLIVKMGIVFVLGALLAFIVAVFVVSASDSIKVRRKKKLLEEIKKSDQKEGA